MYLHIIYIYTQRQDDLCLRCGREFLEENDKGIYQRLGLVSAVSTSASVELHIYEPNWKTETLHLGILM